MLFSILLLFTCTIACAQLTYETLVVDYDSAVVYKNLKIIPIRAKDVGNGGWFGTSNIITLSHAIKNGVATVTERGTASTENVHWLRINNNSDSSIYVSSGELVAGGRQDRMVMRDTILPPSKKDQYIPAMCVEEDRWSDKEKPFIYSGFANTHLRKMLDSSKNQVQIWREINYQLERGNFNSKTLAYLSQREPGIVNRKKKVKNVLLGDDYFDFFLQKFKTTDTSVVGFICVSGNKILGSDIFAGVNLFNQQLEPLLRGYIDEALLFGSQISLPDEQVQKYMDKILTDVKSQEDFVSKNGKIFRHEGKVIHINTF